MPADADLSWLAQEAETAERAGFDAVFYPEHHGSPGCPADPLTIAAMALSRVDRLRGGPLPMLLPFHNPLRAAERTALIDRISNGRLIMGVGAGYLGEDFAPTGIDLKERGPRTDEALEVLRRVWMDDTEPFVGRFHTHGSRMPLAHPPSRAGGPPIWYAGTSRAGIERAARLADGIVIDTLTPSARVREIADAYRKACVEHGRHPGLVVAMRRIWFGGEAESERYIDQLLGGLRQYASMVGSSEAPWLGNLTGADSDRSEVRDRVFVGDAIDVADRLNAWCKSTGVNYPVVKFHWMRTEIDVLPQLEKATEFCARLSEYDEVPLERSES